MVQSGAIYTLFLHWKAFIFFIFLWNAKQLNPNIIDVMFLEKSYCFDAYGLQFIRISAKARKVVPFRDLNLTTSACTLSYL